MNIQGHKPTVYLQHLPSQHAQMGPSWDFSGLSGLAQTGIVLENVRAASRGPGGLSPEAGFLWALPGLDLNKLGCLIHGILMGNIWATSWAPCGLSPET